jgi:hypothetical protein
MRVPAPRAEGLLACVLLAGCSNPLGPAPNPFDDEFFQDPPSPLPADSKRIEYKNIWIDQNPPVAADAAAGYTGWIGTCYQLYNPNPFKVYIVGGEDWFQVPEVGGDYVLTNQTAYQLDYTDQNATSGRSANHFVHASETANGTARYAIRIWTEIVDARTEWGKPVDVKKNASLLTEQWYNITYTPFASQTHEGEPFSCLDNEG